MKTIYWLIDERHIQKCEVIAETERSYFVTVHNGKYTDDYYLPKTHTSVFETLEEAEKHQQKTAAIREQIKQLQKELEL